MFKISYIYDLVDNISPQLKKIQSNLEATRTKTQVVAQSMANSFDKVQKKLSDVGKRSSQIGRDLFLKTTLPISLLGSSFVKAASDYQESLNKVDVAFGNSANSVKSFSEIAGKNFGIDRGRALDMAAMFGDMSTAMGLTQKKAADISTSLVGLAGDLASFKNIRVEEATTALAGVFTGETESLKRLGIVMTETNLEQFALTNGVTKKLKAFTQAEKVLLRYNYIMAMSKNSIGDFARTQAGFANQTRILSSRFKDLSITLGTILLPYAIKLVNFLIKITEKFQSLSPATQKIILVIAGLVAILAPLLIIFGFMASGIAALIVAFKYLALAGGLVAGAINFITIAMRANPLGVMITAVAAAILYWKELTAIIDNFINKIKNINFGKIKGLLGFKNAELNNNLNKPINKPQQMTAGGQLDVNIKGLPKGSSAGFIPKPNNFLPVGLNTVYGG